MLDPREREEVAHPTSGILAFWHEHNAPVEPQAVRCPVRPRWLMIVGE